MVERPDAAPIAVQFQGKIWARWLLQKLGWRLDFAGLPARQGVLIVYPHTSNWDFVVMMLAKWALGLEAHFWGKDSLFRVPLFGRWMRWIGGVPVDRSKTHGAVGQTVALMQAAKQTNSLFWLGLAPEGTRKRKNGWRSGFYRTTVLAQVPLGLIKLDYAKRHIDAREFIELSGEPEQDMQRIARAYSGVQGYHPQEASPVSLLDTMPSQSIHR